MPAEHLIPRVPVVHVVHEATIEGLCEIGW